MRPHHTILLLVFASCGSAELPDIRSVEPDLVVPETVHAEPAPGKRVYEQAPEYAGTDLFHALYLPSNWRPVGTYPVIVEYAGNGPYSNKYNDVSTGEVDGTVMGYGLSGGEGFVWLALPYVNSEEKRNQSQWWGDVEATVEYAKLTVKRTCERYGGDPSKVILVGFSRGAIACGFIGLHDDEIAALWRGFMPYSHYDGVREWDYPGSDRMPALARLKRLNGRPSFVTHEGSIEATRSYLQQSGIEAPFEFHAIPYRNHNAGWTLRDIPARRAARSWLARVLEASP